MKKPVGLQGPGGLGCGQTFRDAICFYSIFLLNLQIYFSTPAPSGSHEAHGLLLGGIATRGSGSNATDASKVLSSEWKGFESPNVARGVAVQAFDDAVGRQERPVAAAGHVSRAAG
ncbi:MAG: hypothetical protein WCK95_17065 [Alphaproteobacteria bacterium]